MHFIRENRLFLALFLSFIAVPWITFGDFHLLLFNFHHNRLEVGGFAAETGTYTLIALVALLGIGIAFLSALSLSRFYCGTLCPNTFFAHLLSRFAGRKNSFFRKTAGFILLAFLSFMLAFSVVAYGISTHELIDALAHLSFSGWLVIVIGTLMISEIYMVQGWYCAYLCPYGAITSILPIEGRLSYAFRDPDHQCTDCGGCVRVCPIPDLDVRAGFDIRCIQCGLCEIACKKIFIKASHSSLIRRASGSVFQAGGRGKGILVAIVLLMVFGIAGVMTLTHSERLESCRLENKELHNAMSAN